MPGKEETLSAFILTATIKRIWKVEKELSEGDVFPHSCLYQSQPCKHVAFLEHQNGMYSSHCFSILLSSSFSSSGPQRRLGTTREVTPCMFQQACLLLNNPGHPAKYDSSKDLPSWRAMWEASFCGDKSRPPIGHCSQSSYATGWDMTSVYMYVVTCFKIHLLKHNFTSWCLWF